MDIRPLTPDFAVSPQIEPEDVAAIAAEGFTAIICNRPDGEVTPAVASDAVRSAAEAAGLAFTYLPIVPGGMSMDEVQALRELQDGAEGPVFAYCNSGTRSSVLWAFSQAGRRPGDEIVAALGKAGYDIPGLREQLDSIPPG